MKALIDTNFMLIPGQTKTDIFTVLREYELVTLDLCIRELEKLAENKGKKGEYARVGIQLINKNKVKIIKSGKKTTDKAILEYAQKNNCAVATNDRKLIAGLKKNGVKVIRLRQKKLILVE